VSTLQIVNLATDLIGPASLDIAAGECVALMGASGAGKSLFLRAIADLDPSTGEVFVGKRKRSDMPASEWRRLVSLVPAESGWWADRVGDHFPSKAQAESVIEAMGLPESFEWDVSRLSSGERQRLAIARALCLKPDALLLDEPTASLDEVAVQRVEDVILDCCGRGMAMLLVTHDRRQAERLSTRVLHMVDGRVDDTARCMP
jgi:ABC-type multidrug transport system ATPase subunit